MNEKEFLIPRIEGWLTTIEAAELLSVTRQTVHTMLKQGKFPSVRWFPGPPNKIYMLKEVEVKDLIKRREEDATARA